NNTVLALFADKDHNLWMGLDDGVDYNAYNTAIKHIYPEKLNEGTGYSARLFNRSLYIGTSNWLYTLPVDNSKDLSTIKGTFKPVDNTKGPAWGLFDLDNNLLLAHHDGAFQIKGNKAIPINTSFGYWGFTPENNSSPSVNLLAGNYEGIDIIRHSKHSFISEGNIKFNESARYVIIKNGIAWVSHNYKGIFKIDLHSPANLQTRLYTENDGLPSNFKDRLFTIKNRMVAATEKGIYEYDAKTDRFEPSAYFKPVFQQKDLRYLKEDSQGNIWFIEGKALGVVDYSGTSPRLIYFPELNGQLVSDFENIYPLDEENIFIGAEKGFYHINYRQYKTSKSTVSVLVRLVKASGDADSILNGGYITSLNSGLNQLRSQQNSLHFEYSAPSYQKQSNIEYSYLLRGFDKEWSAWSKHSEKDYTNLPDGHYTFQIRARGNLGDESAITRYSFNILPPWYKTSCAYVFYGFLFMAFNYLFYRLLQRKFGKQRQVYKEEEKRLKYLHQLEMDRSEKEIIALKNEKLESEILGKNSELAAVAMHLLQKGELLAKIKEEIVQLRKDTNDLPSEELKKLIRILNQESKVDKDWEQFVTYFDNTHSDFLQTLKKTHPLLSPHDLKLCAYLRMNLSSKEIAQLLNISVRGVEISRYRLRKKLQLPTELNLYNYFTDFSIEKKEKTE
ncbi:triple tyrosine motif-containing protein, partial [uncultured Mucilaginibacter sp.]|uniref:triple tyrosine motif-containing protein n=1 Tax=uncultured Mucilaginibacter sp. TaxID=797541 RepID=UPI0025DB6787